MYKRQIIAIDARLVPVLSLSRKKSGKPNRRAAAKHTICRLVRLNATFVLTLDTSLPLPVISVSYTHLDVYKRQVPSTPKGEQFSLSSDTVL